MRPIFLAGGGGAGTGLGAEADEDAGEAVFRLGPLQFPKRRTGRRIGP